MSLEFGVEMVQDWRCLANLMMARGLGSAGFVHVDVSFRLLEVRNDTVDLLLHASKTFKCTH